MNEKKNKTMSVYRLIYILIPKKPAFANSQGPWGEGRNEENRKEKDIFFRFPFILRVLTVEFFIAFFVFCGERFSVIPRKWAIYATARASYGQKFEEICHLFDCLRLCTSGPGSWKADQR